MTVSAFSLAIPVQHGIDCYCSFKLVVDQIKLTWHRQNSIEISTSACYDPMPIIATKFSAPFFSQLKICNLLKQDSLPKVNWKFCLLNDRNNMTQKRVLNHYKPKCRYFVLFACVTTLIRCNCRWRQSVRLKFYRGFFHFMLFCCSFYCLLILYDDRF